MNILAVIHARGGSKRIPLKNLANVGGKPLVAYPILLCKASRYINRIVLSTDHPGIMKAGQQYGAEVPFTRPAAISEDVPSELVTLHALKFLIKKEKYVPDIVITLTPATPFTRAADLDAGIKLLIDHPGWDSVVTVRKAHEHPEWIMWCDDKKSLFKTVLGNSLDGKYNVSQNLRAAFYPCGAFFINRADRLLKLKSLYGKKFGAVVLDPAKNIDIDVVSDLEKARQISTAKK
jgi:CMP-N-acetylneuraminic acid synthetase